MKLLEQGGESLNTTDPAPPERALRCIAQYRLSQDLTASSFWRSGSDVAVMTFVFRVKQGYTHVQLNFLDIVMVDHSTLCIIPPLCHRI